MAVLVRTYDPVEGPILNVEVVSGDTGARTTIPLLLDSGADGCCLSPDVISSLGLLPIGKRSTFASGGSQGSVRTYIVDLVISFDEGPHTFRDIVVSEFLYMKPSIRGLIGRDILCKGDFSMRADHNFSFELVGV